MCGGEWEPSFSLSEERLQLERRKAETSFAVLNKNWRYFMNSVLNDGWMDGRYT